MGLKENIKKYRLENDMTLEDVANRVGVSRQTIQKYESGVISNIPSDKIEKLAEIFHTSPSELMGWDILTKCIDDSQQEFKFENVLDFIDCDVTYNSWLIPPNNWELESNQYYSIKYEGAAFNVTTDEYIELKNKVRSYLRFTIQELMEKHNIKN